MNIKDMIRYVLYTPYQLARAILFGVHDEFSALFRCHVILRVKFSFALMVNFILAFNTNSFFMKIRQHET